MYSDFRGKYTYIYFLMVIIIYEMVKCVVKWRDNVYAKASSMFWFQACIQCTLVKNFVLPSDKSYLFTFA